MDDKSMSLKTGQQASYAYATSGGYGVEGGRQGAGEKEAFCVFT